MTAQIRNKVSNFGSSRPQTIVRPRPNTGFTIPKPANDNWRPIPRPANDNWRPPPPPKGVKLPSFAYARRVFPYMWAAREAYDFWNKYYQFQKALSGPSMNAPGWITDMNCFSGHMLYGQASTQCNNTTLKTTYATWVAAGSNPQAVNLGAYVRYYFNVLWDFTPTDTRLYNRQRMYKDIVTAQTPIAAADRPVYGYQSILPANLDMPLTVPMVIPQFDPFALPVPMTPLPIPRPIPYHAPKPNIMPGRSPQESPSRGPRPRPRPRPAEQPTPGMLVPRVIPSRDPRVRVETSPNHARKPPGNREKQKKWSEGVAGSIPSQALNAVTEANDVVEAIWKSIPAEHRQGGNCQNSMLCMAKDIYKNAEHINIADAIENLIANAIEDAIAGRLIGKLQNAAIGAGLNPGAINPGGRL